MKTWYFPNGFRLHWRRPVPTLGAILRTRWHNLRVSIVRFVFPELSKHCAPKQLVEYRPWFGLVENPRSRELYLGWLIFEHEWYDCSMTARGVVNREPQRKAV